MDWQGVVQSLGVGLLTAASAIAAVELQHRRQAREARADKKRNSYVRLLTSLRKSAVILRNPDKFDMASRYRMSLEYEEAVAEFTIDASEAIQKILMEISTATNEARSKAKNPEEGDRDVGNEILRRLDELGDAIRKDLAG